MPETELVALYKELLSGNTFGKDKHFSRAYIPLNSRAHLENIDYTQANNVYQHLHDDCGGHNDCGGALFGLVLAVYAC